MGSRDALEGADCAECGVFFAAAGVALCSWCASGMTQEKYDRARRARVEASGADIMAQVEASAEYRHVDAWWAPVDGETMYLLASEAADLLQGEDKGDLMYPYVMHRVCPFVADYWNIDVARFGGVATCYYHESVPLTFDAFKSRFAANRENIRFAQIT